THTIYNRPVNLYVAGFIGSPQMNMLHGTLDGSVFTADDGTAIPADTYAFTAPVGTATTAVLGVRPEHVVLGEDARKMPFSLEIEIEIVEPMGYDTLAWTKIAGVPVTFRVDSDVHLTVGQKLVVGFDPARGSIFNAETTNRL